MLITRQTCRSCGSSSLTPIFSLGEQVLAGNFGFSEALPQVQRKIPLDLVRCDQVKDEHSCGLVQLRHTVPGDLMYSSYGYRSGLNELMQKHLAALTHELETRVQISVDDIVVDIGANDGTLLKAYQSSDFRGIGFEPSIVQPEELPANIEILRDYFSATAYHTRFGQTKAKIITSIAMFYDLEDPNAFVADVASLLHLDGLWVIEVAYLPKTLERNSFDTICHEHLLYYSLSSIEPLLRRHGLFVADVEENFINGGTIRVYVCHRSSRFAERTPAARMRVYAMQRKEFEMKLDTPEPFQEFVVRTEKVRTSLPGILRKLKAQGHDIYGYGASTKGNVILQYCDIGPELLTAVADRNPAKWRQKTPGTNIPICSEEEMRDACPDYLLVLPWSFLEAFVAREAAFIARGGKFIVPLPETRLYPE
jgi:hypothetical protein